MEKAPTFYGNHAVQQALEQMLQRDRMAHGFLFYGDPGLGKKTLALRTAAALLCSGTEKPCGVCKSCRMLQKQTHPDLTIAEHSGKRGSFSVETVCRICADLATPPNEGDAKCYAFFDCDAMETRTQNLLLKAIEEPPDHTYFFFTVRSPVVLLPTVRSRIASMALMPVSEIDCRSALLAHGCSPEDCDQAIGAFHGNIGACLDFLENETIRETVALTKSAIHSIIKKDEYTLLQIAANAAADRARAQLFLTLLDRTLRDAAALKYDPNAAVIGCDADGASRLAARMTAASGQTMHLAVDRAYDALQANVNLPLALSALCAAWMDTL